MILCYSISSSWVQARHIAKPVSRPAKSTQFRGNHCKSHGEQMCSTLSRVKNKTIYHNQALFKSHVFMVHNLFYRLSLYSVKKKKKKRNKTHLFIPLPFLVPYSSFSSRIKFKLLCGPQTFRYFCLQTLPHILDSIS